MNRSTKISIFMSAVSAMYFAGSISAFADESSTTVKAESGPGGAKVSKTKTSMQGNADGSVSANRTHESHAVTPAGSAHHSSASSTTLSPDGSTSTVKQDAKSTTP